MKKRIVQYAAFLLSFLLICSLPVAAAEQESLEHFSGADSLWEILPEGVDGESISSLLEEEGGTGFLRAIWRTVCEAFSIGLQSGYKSFLSLCGLVLLSALFHAVKESFGLKEMESAFDFLFLLAISLITFSSLRTGIEAVTDSLSAIHSFFLASLPVTTILLALSGAGLAGSALQNSLSLVLGLVSALIQAYLVPVMNTLFAFSLVDGVTKGPLKGFLAFLKKTVKILCVLFFTLVSAALSLQNALAVAADSLAMRSVRFAAGNFIPVVGPLVGEGSKMLAASFSMVKARCGVLCLLVLLYVILRPILCIAVQKIFLRFAGALSEILEEERCKSFFASLSSLLDLLLALMISESCYLVFYVTLFLKNEGNL